MTDQLIVFLGETPDSQISWYRLSEGKPARLGALAGAQELSKLRPLAGANVVVSAYLPAEQCVFRRFPASSKNAQKLRSVANFLLEDALSEPTQHMHVTVRSFGEEAELLAVPEPLMDRWTQAFAESGLALKYLASDAQFFLRAVNAPAVIVSGERVIWHTAGSQGGVERVLFEQLANDLFAEHLAKQEAVAFFGDDLKALKGLALADYISHQGSLDIFFNQPVVDDADGLNLLSGRYRVRKDWAGTLKPWRRVGALAACFALFAVIAVLADAWRADRISQRWASLMGELHEKSFPDSAGMHPVSHARAVLATADTGNSFTAIVADITRAVQGTENVYIDRIGFDRQLRRLTVSVRSSSDSALEALRVELGKQGVVVRDNGGYRRSQGQWVGELLADIS